MRVSGSIYRRKGTSLFWIKYSVNGRVHRESGGHTEKEARKKLLARRKEIEGDRFVGPQAERVMVSELLDAAEDYRRVRGVKSNSYVYHGRKVRDAFGAWRAIEVRPEHVEAYKKRRLSEKAAPATVDRELEVLRRAFRLAVEQERLARAPRVELLRRPNARRGFFERHEVEAVIRQLPSHLADLVLFCFLSAWRKGEAAPLRWEQIDRQAGEARLWDSKNGRPRVLPLEGELSELIERRWRARAFATPSGQTLSEFVFHDGGRQPGDFRKAWRTACEKAGTPRRLFHDLRRSAVRSMVAAGVSPIVAMEISGHKTRSVFDRYSIVSGTDTREALRRTQTFTRANSARSNVEKIR